MSNIVTYGYGDGPAGPGPGPGPAVTLIGVSQSGNSIIVTLSEAVQISNPASVPSNWLVSGPETIPISSVQVSGAVITLLFSGDYENGIYTLNIPTAGIASVALPIKYFQGPFNPTFAYSGVAPAISNAKSLDEFNVEVVFNKSMNVTDAIQLQNWSFLPVLAVFEVSSKTNSIFNIKTSSQPTGAITVTATNIRDTKGNFV